VIKVKVIGLNKFKRTLNKWERGTRKLEKYIKGSSPHDDVASLIEKHIEDQYKSTYRLIGWPTTRVRKAVESFTTKNAIIIDFTSRKAKSASKIYGVVDGMLSVVKNNSKTYTKIIEETIGKKVEKLFDVKVDYTKG